MEAWAGGTSRPFHKMENGDALHALIRAGDARIYLVLKQGKKNWNCGKQRPAVVTRARVPGVLRSCSDQDHEEGREVRQIT